jgi:hypothetical protein
VVVFTKLPDVPVTVTVAVPAVAVLLAVRVRVLVVGAPEVVTGFGLNDEVTPLGRPEADRLTLPLKPFSEVRLIALLPLAPWAKLKLFGEAESAKPGAALTVRETEVLLVKLPDVPVTVTVAGPVVALLLAVRVRVLVVVPPEVVTGFGLNDAVTPLGRLEAERLTLPLKPFCGVTVIVLVPESPCVMPKLLDDAERA